MKILLALSMSTLAVVASIGPITAQVDLADAPAVEATITMPAAEDAFVARLDAARVEAGLAPLRRDDGLVEAARGWARWMGERRELRHADDIVTGAPDDWTKAGENVGRGGTVGAVWDAFMASPSHAANVLDPAFTRIGVGVVRTPEGVLYTVHRFAGAVSDRPVDGSPPIEQPDPPIVSDPDPGPVDLDAPPPLDLALDEGLGRDGDATPLDAAPMTDPDGLLATMRLLLAAWF